MRPSLNTCSLLSYNNHNCPCGCVNPVGGNYWNTHDCGIQKEEENRTFVVSLLMHSPTLLATCHLTHNV